MPAQAEEHRHQPQGDQVVVAAIVVILLSGLTIESLTRHLAALLIPLGIPPQAIAAVVGLVGEVSFDLDGTPTSARGAMARASAVKTATYLLAATRRLAAGGPIEAERKFWRLHRGAARARRRAAEAVDRAAAQFGPVLGWHSTLDDRTTADCRWLHGKNFHIARPPDGEYPGARHGGNCRCRVRGPWPRGRVVTASAPSTLR